MRVTNGNMMSSYLKDIQSNLQSMNKLNKQLNTGKQVNKISDDPLKAVKIMNLNNEIDDIQKYNGTCDEVTGWLDVTDSALDSVGSLTSEIKTLLKSISGAVGEDEIKSIATDVNGKIQQMGEAFNTTYAGKYIFGGTATDTAPVKFTTNATGNVSLSFNTNDGKVSNEMKESLSASLSSGVNMEYSLNINQISDGGDMFTLLNSVSNALNKNPIDTTEIGELSEKLDSSLTDILNNRSVVGSRSNTVSSVKEANDDNAVQMEGVLSNIQDVDVTEKYIQYSQAQMVYTASLQVSSKLFQTTILDYIR